MFANTMKTGLLMFGLVALFTAIGGLLGNQTGALIGLLIAGGMSFYSYWFSDTATIKAYNGIEVTAASNPRLYGIVQRLAQRANLPMPKVYIVPEDNQMLLLQEEILNILQLHVLLVYLK